MNQPISPAPLFTRNLEGWPPCQFHVSVLYLFSFLYFPKVANSPIEAANITKVAIHPTARSPRGKVNCPITLGLADISMVITIRGVETTPFSTADQNSARIGFSPTK